MRNYFKTLLLLFVLSLAYGCFNDRDDNGIFASGINDFVWKGMNAFYLYKDNVPDLANDRFSSDQAYGDYLNSFENPEDLFESLIYQPQTVDRFSWITDDYIALEQFFSGVTKSNGMKFGLRHVPGSTSSIYGYVRLILPNSVAENEGLVRGMIFDGVDGVALTEDNFSSLLSQDSYTINLATYDNNGTPQTDDDSIISGSDSVMLTKEVYSENPIFNSQIFDVDGENVGYLMYNQFTADYNSQLNAVFSSFLANNVQHLVLDLRYNPGGSVNTAVMLSSMITGQFTGQVHHNEQWNSDLQAAFIDQSPESLVNRFVDNNEGTALNSLNLNKVYILTTGSSASASELVINCLNPYINVVQIGTTTTGKYQASITVYDSPNFGRNGANPNHTYAMQPLVLKTLNSVGFTDYNNGLSPSITQEEDISNLGVLGDETEPLLAIALNEILNNRAIYNRIEPVKLVGDSNDFIPFAKDMYIDRTIELDIKSKLQY